MFCSGWECHQQHHNSCKKRHRKPLPQSEMRPSPMVSPSNHRHQQNPFLEKHTQERVQWQGRTIDPKKQAKKAGIDQVPYQGTYLIPVVKTFISKAYKQFRHLKKDDTHRDSWIAQLIAAQASVWNWPKKAIWKQLRSTERIQRTAKNVRQALHKMQAHNPLAMVEAPGCAPGTWQVYHQKVELEQACLEEASQRFAQAKKTPLLTSPLVNIFGECGNLKEVAWILTGTTILPALCNPHAVKFLTAIACPKGVEEIIPRSTQAYCHGWRKARETMGSSTSGIHFGHYSWCF